MGVLSLPAIEVKRSSAFLGFQKTGSVHKEPGIVAVKGTREAETGYLDPNQMFPLLDA